MNKKEMQSILSEHLSRFRNYSYEDLAKFVKDNHVETFEITSQKGNLYQIKIDFFWDGKPNGSIRVMGSIDENPHRPMFDNIPILKWIPIYASSLTNSFIMSSVGKFIGE
ncbi:MAG: hypothetical protein GXO99_04730 [Nitrospirae bacterium]|nr:hypothetical protein [Nitrospirota bacterium]